MEKLILKSCFHHLYILLKYLDNHSPFPFEVLLHSLQQFGASKHDLKELKKGIEKNLFEYLGELFDQPWDGRYGYTITHSWAALFVKGNYGHIHSHGEADIAGVYYHELPENSGGLFFEPPAPGLCDSLVFSKWGRRMTPNVSEGTMLLFPGFLKHGIETNKTDLDRLSLSFNIQN